MNSNINNLYEDNKKSKNKIKENEDIFKKYKNKNEDIINELNKKYLALEVRI